MTRVCAESGCVTQLSNSNPKNRCRIHQERRLMLVPTVLLKQHLPEWAPFGACASRDTDLWFRDDVASAQDFPDTAVMSMLECVGCDYRRECLEWAYEGEQLDRSRLADADRQESDRRYGVFGGIPGRIRERFADEEDRIAKCLAWFQGIANARGWTRAEDEEVG